MDDKLLRLARKVKAMENELNKITQIEDLQGLLFVNTEITNKYKKSINDVVNTYKDYISKTQKELSESMNILKKESKEKTIKDKNNIDNLDNKINKIKEDIKNICVSLDKSIEDIQKDILKDIKNKNNEILSNLSLKDREISRIKKENEILNDSLVNLKDMFNKLELQKGDNGKSAYEIACELGFKGTVEEWIKSLHGKDGKDVELRGLRGFNDAPKDNKIYGRKNKKWVEVTGGGGSYDDTEIREEIADLEENKADKSEIPDTSNFITNAVNNLLNYYLKSETYTKQEVNNLIGQIATLQFQVVNELPQTGDSKYIYLVPSANPKTKNVKDEYIWINNAWEQIGSTQVDLTGYATETWVNTQISGFLTQAQIQNLIITALVGYAKTEDIPTETTISNWGFTKNTGTYSKPSGGIPKTDLANDVKEGLNVIVTLTQAEYDALVSSGTVDANTYYDIIEE